MQRGRLEKCREDYHHRGLEELRESRRREAVARVTQPRRCRTLELVILSAARKAREGPFRCRPTLVAFRGFFFVTQQGQRRVGATPTRA
jgi:hypothetical protein